MTSLRSRMRSSNLSSARKTVSVVAFVRRFFIFIFTTEAPRPPFEYSDFTTTIGSLPTMKTLPRRSSCAVFIRVNPVCAKKLLWKGGPCVRTVRPQGVRATRYSSKKRRGLLEPEHARHFGRFASPLDEEVDDAPDQEEEAREGVGGEESGEVAQEHSAVRPFRLKRQVDEPDVGRDGDRVLQS